MLIKNNLDKIKYNLGRLKDAMKIELPVLRANHLIGLLKDRGYQDRDRLFRKIVEEIGEYAEAMEYERGATRKVAKYQGKITPKEKLVEEISDVIMVGFALARVEGMMVEDVLETINKKLEEIEREHQEALKKYEDWLECPDCSAPMFEPSPATHIDCDAREEDGPWFWETDETECPKCGTLSWVNVDDDRAYVSTNWEKKNETE